MGSMARILIWAEGEQGHRREYLRLFESLILERGARAESRRLKMRDLLSKDVVFSPMLEDHSLKFLTVALLRSVFGARSIALMFRPREVVESSSFKHRIKYYLLRAVRNIESIGIITILPFSLNENFSRIADDWIYDPQLWDILGRELSESELSQSARSLASGRKIVVALGSQNREKGFHYFSDIWCADPSLRGSYLFVCAGRVSVESKEYAERLSSAGALVADRFVSDEEVLSLYGVADYIWACYSPNYDQASGVFGRAVQAKRLAFIREGAYVGALAGAIGHPTISMPWGDAHTASQRVIDAEGSDHHFNADASLLADRSKHVIVNALGIL